MASIEELEARAAPLLAPIPGDNAAGADASFDPAFEKVKAEIDKLTALSGGQPNWMLVESDGADLLARTSKDLRVAVWVVAARAHRAGWEGLAEGLVTLRGLLRDFWDTMYPDKKRGRARGNLAGWLGEHAAAALDGAPPDAGDLPSLEAAFSALHEIDALLREKLGDLHPGMGPLASLIAAALATARASAPAPGVGPTPPSAAPPARDQPPAASAASAAASPGASPAASTPIAAPPAAGPLAGVSPDDDPVAIARECSRVLAAAAEKARRADPTNAWPYVLTRSAAWLAVRAPPVADQKTTRLPSPPPEVQRRIERHRDAERWLEMLDAAEGAARDFIFWLEPHRSAALALERLGEAYAPAREAVVRETLAFLERFPTLATLTFSDGVPFAGPATIAWLDGERKKRGGGAAAPVSKAVSDEDEAVAKRFAEARDLVAAGKIAEGLGLANELASRGPDGRTRFRSRLAVAELAIEAGKPDVARPILESLAAEADRIGLETWDPPLCAAVYARLMTALASGREDASLSARVFDRLCRLDPAAALRVMR